MAGMEAMAKKRRTAFTRVSQAVPDDDADMGGATPSDAEATAAGAEAQQDAAKSAAEVSPPIQPKAAERGVLPELARPPPKAGAVPTTRLEPASAEDSEANRRKDENS